MRLVERKAPVLNYLDEAFLLVYTVEFGLRLFAGGWWALADNWIRADSFLVAVGVVSKIVAAIVDSDELNLPMILRTIRLVRLDRMVKLVVQFRDLRTLVRG